MYAILEHGGHQYRVTAGDRVLVDRIPVEVGSTVTLESVLLLVDDAGARTDAGSLREASVTATVVAHRRGRKIRVFKYKPKKRTRRTLGFRSQLTELRIDEVRGGDAKRAKATPARAPKAAAEASDAPAAEASEAPVAEAVETAPPEPATPAKPAPKRRAAKPKPEAADGA